MTQNKGPTPNDQRSNVKNPNNVDHRAAQDNRANQMNPNHAPTKSNSGAPSQGKGGK